jgi:hypothetical protein
VTGSRCVAPAAESTSVALAVGMAAVASPAVDSASVPPTVGRAVVVAPSVTEAAGAPSSSASAASAVAGRWEGPVAVRRPTRSASSLGVSGRSVLILGTVSWACLSIVATGVAPLSGAWPASRVQSTQPSA